jgi:hypothetical protein
MTVIATAVVLFGLLGEPARADDGVVTVTRFTPGTGPLASSLLTPEQLAALPTDVQLFLNSHHVGDTWSMSTTISSTPGAAQPSGCPDPNNCDNLLISLAVELDGSGLAWDTTAGALIDSKRLPPGPATINQTLEFRHHDNNPPDFNVVVEPMQGPFCNSTYCEWSTSASDLRSPVVVHYVVLTLPPSFDPNRFFDLFVSSAKTTVTDSNGTNNSLCAYATEDTPYKNTTMGICNPANPLP